MAMTTLRSLAFVILAAMIVTGPASIAPGLSLGAPGPAAPPAPIISPVTASTPTLLPPPSLTPHPSAGPAPPTFYQSNSDVAHQADAQQLCTRTVSGTNDYNNCYPQAQNPSLLRLANGKVGVGYSVYTSVNATQCANSASSTASRAGFQTSSNGGATFGPIQYLGNETCSWLQAIETSFAVGGNGDVYGTFVEENHSFKTYPTLPRDFGPFYPCTCVADRLGFVRSTDNASTWGPVVTLSLAGNGSIARPQIAAFGQSVYIVYENASNSTTYLYPPYATGAVGLLLIYSKDAGNTWNGPYPLTGLNSSAGALYNAMGVAIAVNRTGTVAVSYATNRSCVFTYYSYCNHGGEDIVVATSKTNGTSWAGPYTVSYQAGELENYLASFYYLNQFFQWEPSTSIAYSTSGTEIYVTWAASYSHATTYAYNNWDRSGVFAGISTTGGTTWQTSAIAAQPAIYSSDDYYNPSVGSGPAGTYLTYTDYNLTACTPSPGCPGFISSLTQWVSTANGTQWSPPELVSALLNTFNYGLHSPLNSWPGYTSSVLVNSTGPLLAYSFAGTAQNSTLKVGGVTYYNWTYPANLSVSRPLPTASGVWLNITATHRPASSKWMVALDGVPFSSTRSYLNVTGLPKGDLVLVNAVPLVLGYEHLRFATLTASSTNLQPIARFTVSQNASLNYSADYLGLDLGVAPSNLGLGAAESMSLHVGSYVLQIVSGFNSPVASPGLPWYFLANSSTTLKITNAAPFRPLYWAGSGNASYSGPGSWANITFNTPLSELVWFAPNGLVNVSFVAQNLPTYSIFQFRWGGTLEKGPASDPLQLSYVATGSYDVTNVSANSSSAGWEYFGHSDVPNPVLVPIYSVVNLSFAYVNLASSPGTIAFQAQGVPSGTTWSLNFNGTILSSSTPWINVTEHPGNFPVQAYAFTTSDGRSTFVPASGASTLSLSPGNTYTIQYSHGYQLSVSASFGGRVSPSTVLVAAGSTRLITATPSPSYSFGGWLGTGLGSYSGPAPSVNVTVGGPVAEVAQFVPAPLARYNLTFRENGLPNGTAWSVSLDGVGYGSSTPTLVVGGLYPFNAPSGLGTYSLAVPLVVPDVASAVEFSPQAYPATVTTNGGTVVDLSFSALYLVSLLASVGGSVSLTGPSGPVATPAFLPNGSVVQILATNQSGYDFVGWSGTGPAGFSTSIQQPTLSLNGSMVETAQFVPHIRPAPLTFTLMLHETTVLVLGTSWTAKIGTLNVTGTGPFLNVTGLTVGTYTISLTVAYSPDGATRYTLPSALPPVHLTQNFSLPFALAPSFRVTLTASAGGTVPALGGWYSLSSTLPLNATPGPGYQFSGWVGTGAGSYTGTNLTEPVTVTGPIQEVATFAPATSSTTTSAGTSSTTWALIGIGVLLLVAAAVVILLPRLRRTPAQDPAEETYSSEETPPPEPSEYEAEP